MVIITKLEQKELLSPQNFSQWVLYRCYNRPSSQNQENRSVLKEKWRPKFYVTLHLQLTWHCHIFKFIFNTVTSVWQYGFWLILPATQRKTDIEGINFVHTCLTCKCTTTYFLQHDVALSFSWSKHQISVDFGKFHFLLPEEHSYESSYIYSRLHLVID